mmetsp:Transcript_72755/g.204287  ORF Transcript_72755/g.204287 Transcript_72755/m.204287 type:complete len:685 (+) Transcript_72755:63-2117(+)
MAYTEAFLRNAWDEIAAARGPVPMAILLPKELRTQIATLGECPLQYMSGRLLDCEDVLAEPVCSCAICSGAVPRDAVSLPGGCSEGRHRLLMRVVAGVASEFDPELYTPGAGELSGIVSARFAAARQRRKEQRASARRVVRAAWHVRHLEASKKRTVRVETLRTSMGDTAFLEMVQEQLDRRRDKVAAGAVPAASLWQQTQRWWLSREGRRYHVGPTPPEPRLVAPVLRRALGGVGAGGTRLGAPLLPPTAVFRMPARAVAGFAAGAIDWNLARQRGLHRCHCSARLWVKVDADAGQRVPRIHVAEGHSESGLDMLDAAAMENLRTGDTVESPLRLVSLAGRVVALTGQESVALALPRPYDQFDTLLRGASPPTSVLPVGWDVTDVAERVVLFIRWTATPMASETLTLEICASEDGAWADGNELAATARLHEELARYHATSAERMGALETILLWPFRTSLRCVASVTRFVRRSYAAFADAAAPIAPFIRRCLEVLRATLAPAAARVAEPALQWATQIVERIAGVVSRGLRIMGDAAARDLRAACSFAEDAVRVSVQHARAALVAVRGRLVDVFVEVGTWRSARIAAQAGRGLLEALRRGSLPLCDLADTAGDALRMRSRSALTAAMRAARHALDVGEWAARKVASKLRFAADFWVATWAALRTALAPEQTPVVRLARVRRHHEH